MQLQSFYSRGVLQPSGISKSGNGVSQLSPLRPVLGNGDLRIEFLRNALTFERVPLYLNPCFHVPQRMWYQIERGSLWPIESLGLQAH